jgi:flagellar protein FlgJ
VQAGRTIGLIDRLDNLMKTTPTGGVAAFTRLAGEVGIDIGGLGDVQAVQALINQIVPQQRQPGSGPMSDADLALFKQSVPRLINTPEGNAIIVQTMRGINQYVLQQSEIADMVANREITPAEARKMLKALPNPLDGFNAGGAGNPDKPKGPTVVDGFTIEAIE